MIEQVSEHPILYQSKKDNRKIDAIEKKSFEENKREFITKYTGYDMNLSAIKKGIKDVVIDGIFAKRIFKGDISAGIMHLSLFWGFFGLFLGTILLALDHYLISFLKGNLNFPF